MKAIKLQTDVPVERAPFTIGHEDPVMLIGSCFTDTMGRRLADMGFEVNVNPFGILYNPVSIFSALEDCINDSEIDERVLFEHDGLWHSWRHHGSFSRRDRQACIDACNASTHQAHEFMQRCRTVVITFGSAYCFTYPVYGDDVPCVVANCHKVPEKEFVKMNCLPNTLVEREERIIKLLLDKGVRLIFTVSPVRHQAYGAHGNQLGKASLLLFVDDVLTMFKGGDNAGQLYYFPAYEIMMDELRDYRFYADDLLHPSALAEEIIWRRFQQACMTKETVAKCDLIVMEKRRAAHRPLHDE